jgi:hypothetical protein
MGNYLSCTLAIKAPGGRCARVILPDGVARQVPLPATAAELMMDAPGHFLADARLAASPGARLAALAADDDLELGAVYAAFPMKRLGTPVEAADAARLATREARRRSARVVAASPVAEEEEGAPPPSRSLRLEEMVDDAEVAVLKHRLSHARSRKPALDTIQEESHNVSSSRA